MHASPFITVMCSIVKQFATVGYVPELAHFLLSFIINRCSNVAITKMKLRVSIFSVIL